MGYQHRIYRFNCGECGTEWILTWTDWEPRSTPPGKHVCRNCKAVNLFGTSQANPNVPSVLYVGHEKNRQLEVYPTPPESSNTLGMLPYSTRSFLKQASNQLSGCRYDFTHRGDTLGEPVFSDLCWDQTENDNSDSWNDGPPWKSCHILFGWIKGQNSCPLWESIGKLCQTDHERAFLHEYMALVKGRNFPMLIPQARIGIAQRRRPDFVVFVPLQRYKYRWYAIELDGAHVGQFADKDESRNIDLANHGYDVLSFRPGAKGYYEEVQRLVERLETEMAEVEHESSTVAVDLRVRSHVPDDSMPF
jgi:hypothetical protein